MANTDWLEIKMYYVTNTTVSITDVVKEFAVPESSVKWHCKREKWAQAREEYCSKVEQKLTEKMSTDDANLKAARIKKLNDIADNLIDKLSQAVTELDKKQIGIVEKTWKTTKTGKKTRERTKFKYIDSLIDTLKAQQIATSVKALKEVYIDTDDQSSDENEGTIEIGARYEEEESNMDSSAETT